MESSFATILPNLSIGVVSVLALVYVTRMFIENLNKHTEEIKEREAAMRGLEREVRTSIMSALNENTLVMQNFIKEHSK